MNRLLTIAEAAKYMAVSYNTVLDWVHSGKLPFVKLPGRREDGDKERKRINIDVHDLDAMIEAAKNRPDPVPTDGGTDGSKGRAAKRQVYEKDWYVKR